MKKLQIKSTVIKQEKEVSENKMSIKTQVTELGKVSKLTFGSAGLDSERNFYAPTRPSR